ncbi:HAD family hydrolase [Paenibacillus sp. TRM 82003]|nr:HAD family hydrolase [Paenibacillus sp. TRM 82003]MCI3923401.1 HAD family hydrolase [Paenibacillus sp. TRM 82003]
MGVIFDLDQTLINSAPAEQLRRNREWSRVYKLVPQLKPFEGIEDVLNELRNKGIQSAVVTASPRSYCEKILAYWNWSFDVIVCYHDTQLRKPHPEPINLAIQKMGSDREAVFSVGDDPKDIQASKKAGITALGALWGTGNREGLIQSNPDLLFETPHELLHFVKGVF